MSHNRQPMTGAISLIAAVVSQAIEDRHAASLKVRADARAFFHDGRLRAWLAETGIHPDSVLRMLNRVDGRST